MSAFISRKKFLGSFKKTKVTSFGGVPYTYNLLKKLKFDKMRLPSLKYITQAGGKLSSELLDEFHLLCKKKNQINNNVWSNRSNWKNFIFGLESFK